VTGGFNGQNYLASSERYDPREGKWQIVSTPPPLSSPHPRTVRLRFCFEILVTCHTLHNSPPPPTGVNSQ